MTRRAVLKRGILLGGAFLVGTESTAGAAESAVSGDPASRLQVSFALNGNPVHAPIEARTTLLDLLREGLDHPGTKKGCDHGQCGACTVHVGGRRVLSCLTLAASVQGKVITTIEGLAHDGELHPLQAAFIEHDAYQCGFCTPGQLMSAAALLKEPWAMTADAVREGMSGNICRCGAYCGIVAAITQVRKAGKA